jgi:hypothetical protein
MARAIILMADSGVEQNMALNSNLAQMYEAVGSPVSLVTINKNDSGVQVDAAFNAMLAELYAEFPAAGTYAYFPWNDRGNDKPLNDVMAALWHAALPIEISGTPPDGVDNVPYSFVPTITDGDGARTFALTGTLPAGLVFSTATGAITGTPTTAETASGLEIEVTDLGGSDTLGPFDIEITAAISITGTPPDGVVDEAYTFTPGTAGGAGTKSFALTGTLPVGLTFSTVTGAITGTPTEEETATGLDITVTDLSGSAALGAFDIEIAAA